MKARTSQQGITLIELMVSLSVAGLLAMIAIPIFTSALPGLRLNDAARQIALDLQQTRMRAIAQSMPFQVNFSNSNYIVQRCSATCADDGGNVELPEGISVTPPLISPQFQPAGTVTATAAIKLSNGTNDKWVCVKIVGQISIQDDGCAA